MQVAGYIGYDLDPAAPPDVDHVLLTRPMSVAAAVVRLLRCRGTWADDRQALDASAGFCAAPWTEAVIRIDGNVLPCCRNHYVYGSIERATLPEIWVSPAARSFRASVARGAFPNDACTQCYRKGKATTLASAFDSLLGQLWERYARASDAAGIALDGEMCERMAEFHAHVRSNVRGRAALSVCRRALERTRLLETSLTIVEARVAVHKIGVIAQACLDFHSASPEPAIVATTRQANLVAICNARCVHCIGLYTGEIVRGEETGGRRIKRMNDTQSARALERADDMTSFFMNGSEFLLHPQWRAMTATLAATGVRLSVSTNGMLLDQRATAVLMQSGGPFEINFSFDGATKATVESIRVNVSYDRLVQNVRHFLQQLAVHRLNVPVCISMVLMRTNVAECAALVALVHDLRPDTRVDVHVSFELLETSPVEAYNRFFEQEWIDIAHPTARASLEAAAAEARRLHVRALYSGEDLADALARRAAAIAG